MEEVRAIANRLEDALEGIRDRGEFPAELADPMLRVTDELRRALEGESAASSSGLHELPAPAAAQTDPSPVEPVRQAAPRSLRMPADKVDRLLEAVGETVLHSRRLGRLVGDGPAVGRDDERIEGELGQGELLLDELQESVIQLRTLPLSSITGAFPRAVRDLAVAHEKLVELEISGADTQLDRVILEGVSESITHLLRNAVAHGIEAPEERRQAGKPEVGRVDLRADQRGSLVAIEVRDDGRGVAAELVEEAGRSGTLADVLAEAGFSTADTVTEVSGRGVGLDAVKTHVESLGGGLEVQSEPGKGTTVTMLLPLTLALLQILVVERGGHRFGLPLTSVEEAMTVETTMSLGGHEAIEVRGRSVPLADLAQILGAALPELCERPPP